MIVLKNSKFDIFPIGIGTGYKYGSHDDQLYIDVIRKGIDSGMNFIDTAEIYGNGHSETLIGKSISNYCKRENIFIATKVSPENLNFDNIIKSAILSCSRLQTNYIDLYQIHWTNPNIPLRETLFGVRYLINRKIIKNFGVCNFSLPELIYIRKIAKELHINISSIQLEYNIFDRTIENDIIPYCEKEGITVIAYSPLDKGDKGNLTNKQSLENIANKYNVTISQLILRWLIRNNNIIAIPLTTNIEHVKENASSNFDINKEDLDFISNTFNTNYVYIPIENIIVDSLGIDNFIPKPEDLAKSINLGLDLKPIRVKHSDNVNYELVEGKVRFWAWIYAHDGNIYNYKDKNIPPIKALVRS